MTSPDPGLVLQLFQRLCGGDGLWKSLQPSGPAFSRRSIFSLATVVRLMVLQRLANATLAQAVQHLAKASYAFGLADCRRVRQGRLSLHTGGYCRARQKLPTMIAIQVFELTVEKLRGWLPRQALLPNRPIYVLDGTTLALRHAPELVGAYPPSHNQHGMAHWPIVRLLVLQDAQTGLALRPHWGPLNGPKAVSEQQLALQAIPHLPAASCVLGDRNFGIFSVAWAADRLQHNVLLRLTRQRAEHLAGKDLVTGYEQNLRWEPSRSDHCGGPFPPEAGVKGRLLCIASPDQPKAEPFYFFTTLEEPADQILKIYFLRWNVETDLRSIKRTVHLQNLSARTGAMMEKELFLALAAYNLVRALIFLAAEKAHVPPRRLSFTNVYTLLQIYLPDLNAASTPEQWDACWSTLIELAATYVLPHRSRTRSYPRKVWRNGPGFPFHPSPELK